MKSYKKCEISNINQKIKSLHECLNSTRETEKSNAMLQNNVTFLQNELIRKEEITKTLTSVLVTVSKPSVGQEVAQTRNEIMEEIQWQKRSSCKKNKEEPKNMFIGNLSLNIKTDDLHELLGLKSALSSRNM